MESKLIQLLVLIWLILHHNKFLVSIFSTTDQRTNEAYVPLERIQQVPLLPQNDRVLLSVMVLTTDSSPHTGYTFTSRVVSLPATSINKHQAPIPLKINVLTFSKSHDIKVMTLVFHPTKKISWHSVSNVMTLISWHWGVDIRLKVNFWWRWRKIITIHA